MISRVQIKKTSKMHEPPCGTRPDADARCKSAVAQQLTGLQMSRRAEATRQLRRFAPFKRRGKYEGEDPTGNL